jgi:hypothetical protein
LTKWFPGLCGVALTLAAGCGRQQPAAPAIADAIPLPAAPAAVLKIDAGAIDPVMAVSGFSTFVFDASGSTGDGLSYLLELADGTTSSTPVTSHVTSRLGESVAKLTVSRRHSLTAARRSPAGRSRRTRHRSCARIPLRRPVLIARPDRAGRKSC